MPTIQTTTSGLFTGEELISLTNRIYEMPLPPLNSEKILTPSGSEHLGAAQFETKVYQHFGNAQWINDYGMDLPRVDVGAIRDLHNIGMFGVSYGYNIREVRLAQRNNAQLDARKSLAGRRAMDEFKNDVFFKGSRAKQITGIANIQFAPRLIVQSDDFFLSGAATPQDMVDALYALGISVSEGSNEAENPDTLLLPSKVYNIASSTTLNEFSNETILEVYKRNAPYAKEVKKCRELDTAGPDGNAVIVVCTLKDETKAQHTQPDPLTILASQQRSLQTIVDMIGETAGFNTSFPLAHGIAFLDR